MFVPSKTGVCFPQSCGSPTVNSHWSSRSDLLGIPNPIVGSPGWEPWCGVWNLPKNGRTSLVLLFSSLWVTHTAGRRFDFIVIVSLPPSCCGFFFVFGYEVSFFGGLQSPLINGYSTVSCNFGTLAGGDKCTSFYSTILNWKQAFFPLVLSLTSLLPMTHHFNILNFPAYLSSYLTHLANM